MPDDTLPRLCSAVDRQAHGSHKEAKARDHTSPRAHPRISEVGGSGRGQCLCGGHGAFGCP
eukprot:4080296-Pleurochrysis_carterae.AAC.1